VHFSWNTEFLRLATMCNSFVLCVLKARFWNWNCHSIVENTVENKQNSWSKAFWKFICSYAYLWHWHQHETTDYFLFFFADCTLMSIHLLWICSIESFLPCKFHVVVCFIAVFWCCVLSCMWWVPRRQPHRRSGLATLPSVGAVP